MCSGDGRSKLRSSHCREPRYSYTPILLGPVFPCCEVRKDNGDVAHFGYDRIGAVGVALLEMAGMDIDVRDNSTSSLPTMHPKIAKPTAIDFDNTAPERVRIYVVVENKLLNPPRLVFGAQ